MEIDPYYYHYARRRLRRFANVEITHGRSVDWLAALASDRQVAGGLTLFYLDAHWHDDLPLLDELRIILAAWREAVIVIDDFEVPDDPGYGYDDYGAGKALHRSYLEPLADRRYWTYYPAARSADETGARRGCAVLTGQERLAETLASVPSLRQLRARARCRQRRPRTLRASQRARA